VRGVEGGEFAGGRPPQTAGGHARVFLAKLARVFAGNVSFHHALLTALESSAWGFSRQTLETFPRL
jgi:hypothetical protein